MNVDGLFQELAANGEIVRALLIGLTPEEARARPDPESWSALEIVCHLVDEEREDFRQRLDLILHHSEQEWPPIDPEGWAIDRGYNDRDLADMLVRFEAERHASLAWLNGLVAPDWQSQHVSPFGTMRAGDMLASWVAHDQLHLRQLVGLRRARAVRLAEPYSLEYGGQW